MTPEEQAAYSAERARVNTFMNNRMADRPTSTQKPKPLTPEEIKAQKAALLRKQLMQHNAPQPVLSGWQRLMQALGMAGEQPQQPMQ